ncbi:uncharacterized protein [Primulina huaijiensis]|uniref:uncharacterized protein n=1 Tax=Primulina huaijiensis TaxID=1492673 RepID=UPI003CC794C9
MSVQNIASSSRGAQQASEHEISETANVMNSEETTVGITTDEKAFPNGDLSQSGDLGNRKFRASYVNLFKNNRMDKVNYKFDYMETGTNKLKICLDEIDSIEQTYGICLLGYVISGKPSTATLFDLIKRWGNDIKFQTHDSAWIVFNFPNIEAKERVLEGGPYMVFGFHIFLKEMPRCFRFREEDMNSVPSWVQIHGLSPDCWNYSILSKLASKVGKLIHMDMLTHERKRVKYACVLIEMEVSKQRIGELDVELPFGDIKIRFEYEQDFKVCEICHHAGHNLAHCKRKVMHDGDVDEDMVTNSNYSMASAGDPLVYCGGRVTRGADQDSTVDASGSGGCATTTGSDCANKLADKGKHTTQTAANSMKGMCDIKDIDDEGFKEVTNTKKNKNKKKGKQSVSNQQQASKQSAVFFEDMEDSNPYDTEYVNVEDQNEKKRGFHKPLKQKSVQSLVNTHKIDVFGILESKMDENALHNLLRSRFPGINEQAIHVSIQCLLTNNMIYASFIYGFNIIVQRRSLWDDLKLIGANCTLSWLVLGDFNSVLSPDEKRGLNVKNYETHDFIDCVATLDLYDLQFTGCFFTWSSPKVCSKLDCALVNNYWLSSSMEGFAEFLTPRCISDHATCVVTMFEQRKRKMKPFKFQNMWTLCDDFEEILNIKKFSNISSRAHAAKVNLDNLQLDMLTYGVIADNYGDVKRNTEMLLEAKRLFIAQKTKIRYLRDGDRCTKFFNDLIKRNNKKNAIVAIQKGDGLTTIDPKEIAQCFLDYYTGILGCKVDRLHIDHDIIDEGPCIQEQQWSVLTAPITVEEIEMALRGIDNDKSSGADGFGASFLKSAWNTIKSDVCAAVIEFFSSRRLLRQWKHSVIAFVPKKTVASSVHEYRPISCCTMFYKLISKILVDRLRGLLGDIVDEAQAAFLQGRSIVDNIHLAHELMRKYGRLRGTPRCILQVDIHEAYDTVDWDFLHEILNFLNFPPRFIQWIMECVTTTSYSIAINGHYHGNFDGKRGLRKGDPETSGLFIA